MNEVHTAGRGQWLFAGWCGRLVGLVAAIACLLAIACAIDPIAVRGNLGFRADAAPDHPGWFAIDRISDGGAARAAGLAPTMFVRFDRPYEAHARRLVGWRVGLWAATGAKAITGASAGLVNPRHLTLIAQPDPASPPGSGKHFDTLSSMLESWFWIVLGLVLVVRGWGSTAALTLALSVFGLVLMPAIPVWATLPWQVFPFLLACAVMRSALLGLMLLPAVLYTERIGRPAMPWLLFFGASAIGIVVTGVLEGLRLLDEPHFLLAGDRAGIAETAIMALNFAAGVYWAWRGWRDAVGADRRRFVVVLATRVVMVAMIIPLLLWIIAPARSTDLAAMLALIQKLVNTVLVPLALAYAVLRHRVVDLAFVLNRILVFGSVGALLLGSFGLIEWGIEHWLPQSLAKVSVWIAAGAALLVCLAFHRAHETVEDRIEHMFAHGWQANAAILRRFVASAPHFEDERALARSFADELSRFAGDARVALYRRKERTHDAILERMAGSWETAPRTLSVDDPAFALMRAERSAIDLADALTDLPGVLALPLLGSGLDHGMLTGLVLMDLKGHRALYRPDEIDVLGWAAHNVALAMAALHVGLVESENRLLKAQLSRLGSLIGDRLDHAEV